jgi:hypothetical protein
MSVRAAVITALSLGLLVGVLGVGSVGAAAAPQSAPRPAADATTPPVPTPTATPTQPPDAVRPKQYPPPVSAPIGTGSYFSFPNRSRAEAYAIRNRVLNTINSTWGYYYSAVRDDPEWPTRISRWKQHRGVIQMTTWSFNDAGVRDALIRAANRGTLVQIIAARSVNNLYKYKPWLTLRATLNNSTNRARGNWARECPGACRGSGGAPHSKYFLFDGVRSPSGAKLNGITVQTSANLTAFAVSGQWNHATVTRSASIQSRFRSVFRASALRQRGGFRDYHDGNARSMFFPKGGAPDPVLAFLNRVRCGGTRVRVEQYAIYGNRGQAIAKKLRSLWNAGCDVRIIYSVSSRPVLSMLRSRVGRGPVPMRQSVIFNKRGEIGRYNHSKWVAVAGRYAGATGQYAVHAGSANWADLGFTSDEQMQEIRGYSWTRPFFANFDKTWAQGTSRPPRTGRVAVGGRLVPATPEEPTFGSGVLRNLSPMG